MTQGFHLEWLIVIWSILICDAGAKEPKQLVQSIQKVRRVTLLMLVVVLVLQNALITVCARAHRNRIHIFSEFYRFFKLVHF